MKRLLFLFASFALLAGCNGNKPEDNPPVDDALTISFPSPTAQLTKVDLNATERGYVDAGDRMAFRFLSQLYDGKNLILSPLSLQYALAMTANGASGQTLQEIIGFLGYGNEGLQVLNAFSKKMLEQLPAVDLDVTLKLTDAILVSSDYPLYQDFKKTVEENYYAAVANMDFSDPAKVAKSVNDWASKNTAGFLDKVLNPDDISPQTVALLMNALYFKARWAGGESDPMFDEYNTSKDAFTLADNTKTQVDYMRTSMQLRYAEMDGYRALELPYADGKFNMYVLLPDKNDLASLVNKLPDVSWSKVLSSMKDDAQVDLRLPKFDMENKYDLTEHMKALGIKKAFSGAAEFDRMFQASDYGATFHIGKVIQKAKISVAEWGTEAAAVTVVAMDKYAAPFEGKRIKFYADHPFIFLIGEASSGAILFEGAYAGK
jgi:serpin B